MKKINILFFALAAVVLFSCNTSSETEEVVEGTVTEEVVEVVEDVKVEAAGFQSDNEDLNAFVAEFDVFFDKSLELLKTGDMEGLQALESEGTALQQKGEALKDAISEEEQAQLEDYMKGRATEMLKASGLDKLGEKFEEMEKEATTK